MNIQTIRLNKILMRFQWEWYRIAGAIGLPGLIACAVLIVWLVMHAAFLLPSISRVNDALTKNTSLQAAGAKEMKRNLLVTSQPTTTFSVREEDILELARRFKLDAREVKYQQMQRGKDIQREGRILINLPTVGSYPQFREMMEELSTMPGGKVETFSLTRKTQSEEMLAIEMRLSVAKDGALEATKAKEVAKSALLGRAK